MYSLVEANDSAVLSLDRNSLRGYSISLSNNRGDDQRLLSCRFPTFAARANIKHCLQMLIGGTGSSSEYDNSSLALGSAAPAAVGSSPDAPRTRKQALIAFAQLGFSFVMCVCFIIGLTGHADIFTQTSGWNEVFTVVGSLFIFPIATATYNAVSFLLPQVTKQTEALLWLHGLRVALFASYIGQQGLFLAYLVTYSGSLTWLFLIPDVLYILLMLGSQFYGKFPSLWVNLYILTLGGKLAVFWPHLDQSDTNTFANKDNALGPNGLMATLMLTIPIVEFPVLISRLKTGMPIVEAYTFNMAAVFAHTLHFLDVLELYFLGLSRKDFAADVQYLLLIFSVMGHVASNFYYVSLFFSDSSVEQVMYRFQPTAIVDVLASKDATQSENLLHYFVWVLFFVDLPYGAMRFVAFCVHGTRISTFFAKNLMMMSSVTMLLFQHSRKR
jgi:hypothetical protein